MKLVYKKDAVEQKARVMQPGNMTNWYITTGVGDIDLTGPEDIDFDPALAQFRDITMLTTADGFSLYGDTEDIGEADPNKENEVEMMKPEKKIISLADYIAKKRKTEKKSPSGDDLKYTLGKSGPNTQHHPLPSPGKPSKTSTSSPIASNFNNITDKDRINHDNSSNYSNNNKQSNNNKMSDSIPPRIQTIHLPRGKSVPASAISHKLPYIDIEYNERKAKEQEELAKSKENMTPKPKGGNPIIAMTPSPVNTSLTGTPVSTGSNDSSVYTPSNSPFSPDDGSPALRTRNAHKRPRLSARPQSLPDPLARLTSTARRLIAPGDLNVDKVWQDNTLDINAHEFPPARMRSRSIEPTPPKGKKPGRRAVSSTPGSGRLRRRRSWNRRRQSDEIKDEYDMDDTPTKEQIAIKAKEARAARATQRNLKREPSINFRGILPLQNQHCAGKATPQGDETIQKGEIVIPKGEGVIQKGEEVVQKGEELTPKVEDMDIDKKSGNAEDEEGQDTEGDDVPFVITLKGYQEGYRMGFIKQEQIPVDIQEQMGLLPVTETSGIDNKEDVPDTSRKRGLPRVAESPAITPTRGRGRPRKIIPATADDDDDLVVSDLHCTPTKNGTARKRQVAAKENYIVPG